ncbi:hypothetical protein SHELI_v1c05730 [Spiroplasma helicoides]|uniref:Uncharacterized protein n=1 Tax=Spiroplasma helicoides TaxID=216938 RepID=A0A1B3SKR7_9MOLU|nr:hypothetical protein [Spiroplasma helicoides]AOG60524.1 hypothetical protein SHELI_v1c05730 [Spiroplasma helicoides]
MSKKELLEYDKNLKMNTDKIYCSKRFNNCQHYEIAIDKRDGIVKCTNLGCWRQFWFEKKEDFWIYENRFNDEGFDFDKSEKEYIESLKKGVNNKDN